MQNILQLTDGAYRTSVMGSIWYTINALVNVTPQGDGQTLGILTLGQS